MFRSRAEGIPPRKRPLASLWIIILFGFTLRIASLGFYRMIDSDSAHYGAIARFFAGGHWVRALDPYWPPLYPLLIGVLVKVGFSLEAAGIAVSLLASSGIVLLCHFLGKRFGGEDTGLLAAGLAAVHPRLVSFSQTYMTEPLYAFFLTGALCVTIPILDRGRRDLSSRPLLFLSLGVLLSLAFLTRPEAFFYLILVAVLGTWALFFDRTVFSGASKPRPAAAVLCLCFLLTGFLIPSLPYLVRISTLQRRVTLGEKAEANFYLAYKEDYRKAGISVELSDYESITDPSAPRRPGDYRIRTFLGRRPGAIAPRMAKNIIGAIVDKIPSLMTWPLFLLSVFGLVTSKRKAPNRLKFLYLGWMLVPVLIYAPLFLYRRFFTPLLAPLIVFGAAGLGEARGRLPRRTFRSILLSGAAILIALGAFSLSRQSWPVLYKEAGLWLKSHRQGHLVLAGRKPEPSFYAETEFRPLDAARFEDLLPFLEGQGITHLIVEDYILPSSHPALAFLLEQDRAPAWLRPIKSWQVDGHALIIYEFRKTSSEQPAGPGDRNPLASNVSSPPVFQIDRAAAPGYDFSDFKPENPRQP